MKRIDNYHPKRKSYGLTILIGLIPGAVPGQLYSDRKRPPASMSLDTETLTTQPVTPTPTSHVRPILPLAPAIELTDLTDSDSNYRLVDFAGQPVIINPWARQGAHQLAQRPALEPTS